MRRSALLATVGIAMLVPVAALSSVFQIAVVSGDSMAPTFHDGQVVLALHSRWVRSGPGRGAVALVRRGDDILVKRVAYLPGDDIAPSETEGFAHVRLFFEKARAPASVLATRERLRVPRGQVVVLGDNRTASGDSREFGTVPVRDIVGYVLGERARR